MFCNWQHHLYVEPEIQDDPQWYIFTAIVEGFFSLSLPKALLKSGAMGQITGPWSDEEIRLHGNCCHLLETVQGMPNVLR
jgi:hypothetical protein